MHCVKLQVLRVNKRFLLTSGTQENSFSRSCHKVLQKGWSRSAVKAYLSKSEWKERRLPGEVILDFLKGHTHHDYSSTALRENQLPNWIALWGSLSSPACFPEAHRRASWFEISLHCKPKMNKFVSGLCLLIQFRLCCSRHHDHWHVSSFPSFLDSTIFLPCSRGRLECTRKLKIFSPQRQDFSSLFTLNPCNLFYPCFKQILKGGNKWIVKLEGVSFFNSLFQWEFRAFP